MYWHYQEYNKKRLYYLMKIPLTLLYGIQMHMFVLTFTFNIHKEESKEHT